MRYRQFLTALTAAALLLTGCQSMPVPAPEEDLSAQMLAEPQTPVPDTTPLTSIVRCDPIRLPDNVCSIRITVRDADGIAGIADTEDMQDLYLHIGNDLQSVETAVLTPPADDGDFSLSARHYAIADNGIWAIALMESHDGMKPYDPETDGTDFDWDRWDAVEQQRYLLCRYAANGTLVSAVSADELLDYREFTDTSAYDQVGQLTAEDGELYVTLHDGRVLRIDKETAAVSVAADLSGGDQTCYYVNELCFDRDGKPVQFTQREGDLAPDGSEYLYENTAREYDLAANAPGQVLFTQENPIAYYSSMIRGTGDYRLFMNSSTAMTGIRDDGTQEVLIDWDASDLLNVDAVPLDETTFFGYCYNDDGCLEAFRLTRRHTSEIRQNEVLTLGVLGTARDNWQLYTFAKQFNRTHKDCRIEFAEHPLRAGNNVQNEQEQAAFRASASADDAPDLMLLYSHSDAVSLGTSGALLDLHTLMDRDVLFGREKFVGNVLTALEDPDGCLYGMPKQFYISTLAAKTKNCGKENWTLADLNALYDGAGPELFRWETKDQVFTMLAEGMDLTNRDEIVQILEFANRFPASLDETMRSYGDDGRFYMDQFMAPSRDEVYIYPAALAGVGHQMACGYSYAKYFTFGGEDITLVGYPSENGRGGRICTTDELAVTAKCRNPEIAWEFVKGYLQQSSAEGGGLSVVNERFEQEMDRCMHIMSMAGKEPPYYEDDGTKIYPLTQAERDDAERYIRSCTALKPDAELNAAALEEAGKYFAGGESAEEAAGAILAKVQDPPL